MTKVSLIIPVYNGEPFIRETLESALHQTLNEFEVIVIDDGSQDQTPQILREYGETIRWKSQPHQGQAFAINAGITLATGEYLAYLDADDVCLPERLAIQAQYLDTHPKSDLVYSDRYQIDQQGSIVGMIRSRPMDPFVLLQQNFIPRSSVMHRRRCLDHVGLFDESNTGNDDWDMWVRISEKFHIDYIDQPLIKYRIHDRNISLIRPNRLNYYRWTRMRMLERTWERRGRPLWLRLLLARARIEWRIGRIALIGEKSPKTWGRVGKVLDLLESLVIRHTLFRLTGSV